MPRPGWRAFPRLAVARLAQRTSAWSPGTPWYTGVGSPAAPVLTDPTRRHARQKASSHTKCGWVLPAWPYITGTRGARVFTATQNGASAFGPHTWQSTCMVVVPVCRKNSQFSYPSLKSGDELRHRIRWVPSPTPRADQQAHPPCVEDWIARVLHVGGSETAWVQRAVGTFLGEGVLFAAENARATAMRPPPPGQ